MSANNSKDRELIIPQLLESGKPMTPAAERVGMLTTERIIT